MPDMIAASTYRLPITINYALTTTVYSALRIQVELEALWNSSEAFRAMVLDFTSTGSSAITITDNPAAFPGLSGIAVLGSAAASNWITGSHIYLPDYALH